MSTPLAIRLIAWAWFISALLLSRTQMLGRLPGLATLGLTLLLTSGLWITYVRIANFRSWINALDLRSLVLLHSVRLVGYYFLLLHNRGELPYAFAVPSGWGEILIATLVVPVCFLPLSARHRHRALTIWNVIGFTEIILACLTATRLALENPMALRAFATLPLSLWPLFLSPVILVTHLIIYQRLQRENSATLPE